MQTFSYSRRTINIYLLGTTLDCKFVGWLVFTLSGTNFSFNNKVGFITSTFNNRRTSMFSNYTSGILFNDSGTKSTLPVADYSYISVVETISETIRVTSTTGTIQKN